MKEKKYKQRSGKKDSNAAQKPRTQKYRQSSEKNQEDAALKVSAQN